MAHAYGLNVEGPEFDPHRPYQPNRLKKHVVAHVHFPVYLRCPLPINRHTMQSPEGASAKLDYVRFADFPDRDFVTPLPDCVNRR